jgi:hypothetical protein
MVAFKYALARHVSSATVQRLPWHGDLLDREERRRFNEFKKRTSQAPALPLASLFEFVPFKKISVGPFWA